ncbi:MAG TPA: VOC family protein [Dongiaceae bacterium]|nr:VOC family protein [Dongiaceae bacterium]
MYDHIGLQVKDVAASSKFYQAALGGLGHVLASQDETGAGLGPKGAPALWLYKSAKATGGSHGGGSHIAFQAASRSAVDRFYKDGIKAGGTDNGKPGIRADYSPNYYAAFLIDPDGNNVEAVYLGA